MPAVSGFLSISQAAKRLGISRQRLYLLIDQGRIHAGEIVGVTVVTDTAVSALLKELRISRTKFGVGARKNGRKKHK